jgi:hypothetical protein
VAVILLEGGGRAYVPISGLPAGARAGRIVEVAVGLVEIAPGEGAEDVAALIERLRAGGHQHG